MPYFYNMLHTQNTHKMKSLSKEDQAQLDALLAKKEAAEKLDVEVQRAVDHIDRQNERLADDIKSHAQDAAEMLKVFKSLEAVDADLFKFVYEEKELKYELFGVDYDGKRKFDGEVEAAAWKYKEIKAVDYVSKVVKTYKINIVGLTGYANKPATVNTQAQYQSSGGWRGRYTGKTQLKMSCADYSERWVTVPKTFVKKIKEELASREAQKAAHKEASSLKDDALCAVADLHPEAHSTFEKEWKHQPSYNRRRSDGYEVEYIKATFENGMELNYRFRRVEDEGFAYDVKVELSKTNFGILAALKAANTPEELATKLSGLYNFLNDK